MTFCKCPLDSTNPVCGSFVIDLTEHQNTGKKKHCEFIPIYLKEEPVYHCQRWMQSMQLKDCVMFEWQGTCLMIKVFC